MEAILQRMRAKQGGGKCPAAKATGAGGGSAKKARPLPVLARTPAADKAADSEHAPWNLDYVLSEDVLSDLTAASEAKQGGEPPEGANPQLEAARHRAITSLASTFQKLCGPSLGKRWYTHFEAWLCSRRFNCGISSADPIIPSGKEARHDPELQRKLEAAGVDAEDALAWGLDLGLAAARALQAMERAPLAGGKAKVKVSFFEAGQSGPKVRVSCAGVHMEINRGHYDKLCALYDRRNLVGGQGGGGRKRDVAEAVFCLLVRYDSLQGSHYRGGGFQAAIHKECFDVLREEFGVSVECFASPLNCSFPTFCSAFLDTDGPFGSLGSFFKLRPKCGSFQANPPFDPDVVASMAKRMDELLRATSEPLAFTVIIPYWPDKSAWRLLRDSPFLQVPMHDHGYFEGAQHNRRNVYRTASFDTSVFFLQNKPAARVWPVTKSKLDLLLGAFKSRDGKERGGGADGDVDRTPVLGPSSGGDAYDDGINSGDDSGGGSEEGEEDDGLWAASEEGEEDDGLWAASEEGEEDDGLWAASAGPQGAPVSLPTRGLGRAVGREEKGKDAKKRPRGAFKSVGRDGKASKKKKNKP